MALQNFLNFIAPKKTNKSGGTGYTGTYDRGSTTGIVTAPLYREHLVDIFDSRAAEDSRALIKQLMKTDPDVSAAFHSYLTLANTEPVILARDFQGVIDADATKLAYDYIRVLTNRLDYSLGFQLKQSRESIDADMRTMLLMRGMIAAELVFNKQGVPSEVRQVDPASLEWVEKNPGQYKPLQVVKGSNDKINLDIPTFFVSFYRRDPTSVYTYSPFVAAINTLAARQQVINDLYRIMRITGFPRTDIKVVEEILQKSVPSDIKLDSSKTREWVNARMAEIQSSFGSIRPDQAYIHTDSVEVSILNEKSPGAALNIDSVIDVLNGQNQAGLKVLATTIGRGDSGVNTASVEARIACMNADSINFPIADIWSGMLSLLLQLNGFQGTCEVYYRPVELRPETELESQLVMRSARLLQDLSLGIISDIEYSLEMYGRLPLPDAPELSGTGFMAPQTASVDAEGVSPNSDPLGRSVASPGSKSAKSNNVKKKVK
jgi:hypothetical protein